MTEISAGKLAGLRRMADDAGFFRMLAVDQRPPLINRLKALRGTAEADDAEMVAIKQVLTRELAPHASAVLADPIWAFPHAWEWISPRQGLIVTLESHRAVDGYNRRKAETIANWGVGKIRRMGADGVKVLAWYRPDMPADVAAHQRHYIRSVGEDCRRFDIPFVLELLVPPLGDAAPAGYVEDPSKRPQLVIDSVRTFAAPEFGVDVFKLESPLPAAGIADPDGPEASAVQGFYDQVGAATGRPWVMLSAGAGKADFRRVVTYALRAGASGFLAGRAIWWEAFEHYPDVAAMTAGLRQGSVAYLEDLARLTTGLGTPWRRHPAYDGGVHLAEAGLSFPLRYAGLD